MTTAAKSAKKKSGGHATLDFLNNLDTGGRQTKMIPLDEIRPDPAQPRRTFHPVDGFVPQEALAEIRELADNIFDVGLAQPITVREADDGGYIIVWGERRWRSFLLNRELGRPGHDTIESFVRDDISDAKRRLVQLAENLQRKDLSDIDTAVYIKAIMNDFPELQQKNLAELLNKRPQWVSRILGLLDPRYEDVVMKGHIIYASILEQFKLLPEESQAALHSHAKAAGTKITSHQIRTESARTKAAVPPVLPRVSGTEALGRLGLGGHGAAGTDPELMNSVENVFALEAQPGENYTAPGDDRGKQELRLRLPQFLRLAEVLENSDQQVSVAIASDDIRQVIRKLGGKPPEDELALGTTLMNLLMQEAKPKKEK